MDTSDAPYKYDAWGFLFSGTAETLNEMVVCSEYGLQVPTYTIPSLYVILEDRTRDYSDTTCNSSPFPPTTSFGGRQTIRLGNGIYDCPAGDNGLLSEVHYPTGGYTKYEYENNQYYNFYQDANYASGVKIGGGMRIKTISHYTATNVLAEKRTYTYGQNECGYGVSPVDVSPLSFQRVYRNCPIRSACSCDNLMYNPYDMTDCFPSYMELLYTAKTRYTRTRIFSQSNYQELLSGRPAVVYPEITEYMGDVNINGGKTVFKYNVLDEDGKYFEPLEEVDVDGDQIVDELRLIAEPTTSIGQLIETKIYSRTNNEYAKLRKIKNEWTYRHVSSFYDLRNPRFFDLDIWNEHDFCDPSAFITNDHIVTLGKNIITSNTTIEYINSDSIMTTEEYAYNDYLQLTSKTRRDSKGLYITENYKYPSNYILEPYTSMVQYNKISPLIEHSLKKHTGSDSVLSRRVKNNYFNWGNNVFELISFESALGNTSLDLQREYTYDNITGNLLTHIDRTNINTVILWGYQGQYPIAKIKNATYTQVSNALSGITPELLSASIIPDMTKVEALRTALPNAMVNTFTYKPLVGITSSTDPRGVTTYYEYDDFNRLKEIYIIENGVKKILKYHNYHYSKNN